MIAGLNVLLLVVLLLRGTSGGGQTATSEALSPDGQASTEAAAANGQLNLTQLTPETLAKFAAAGLPTKYAEPLPEPKIPADMLAKLAEAGFPVNFTSPSESSKQGPAQEALPKEQAQQQMTKSEVPKAEALATKMKLEVRHTMEEPPPFRMVTVFSVPPHERDALQAAKPPHVVDLLKTGLPKPPVPRVFPQLPTFKYTENTGLRVSQEVTASGETQADPLSTQTEVGTDWVASVGNPNMGSPVSNVTHQTTVVSSWVLIGMLGEFAVPLADSEKPWIMRGVRDAVADTLEICRCSVSIVDLRGLNVVPYSSGMPFEPSSSNVSLMSASAGVSLSSLDAIQALKAIIMRRAAPHRHLDPFEAYNITRIRATYEVRIFPAMRASMPQIARRIDLLQTYIRFNDFSRMTASSLATTVGPDRSNSISVVLDDLGYGSVQYLQRPALENEGLEDCIEEGRLYDARQVHKFVVAFSMVLIVLTTCAGSAVFAIKQPTSVPSRLNPLLGPTS